MGITSEQFFMEGIKLFLEIIHPEQVELWLRMIQEITTYIAENIKIEDRIRFDI